MGIKLFYIILIISIPYLEAQISMHPSESKKTITEYKKEDSNIEYKRIIKEYEQLIDKYPDKKDNYVFQIPRTIKYIYETSKQHPFLEPLHQFINKYVY